MNKKILLVPFLVSIFSFSCSNLNNQVLNDPIILDNSSNVSSKEAPFVTKIKLDPVPFISQQANELSAIALNDDGRIYKYQTLKSGAGFQATTFLYQNKWSLIESHPTTALEAQTILRLASQGGFAKEFKTLKDRYEQIGLVDSKK